MAQNALTETYCNTNKVPKSTPSKCRNWCFTLNNYTENEISTIIREKDNSRCNKYCFQEEKGDNGTPHLQGTLAYKHAISFNTVKKLLPKAHWEKARSLNRALAYCCKKDTRNGHVWMHNYKQPFVYTRENINNDIHRQMLEDIDTIDWSGISL